eukprot:1564851-Pyramimonas_sp.AAC.1
MRGNLLANGLGLRGELGHSVRERAEGHRRMPQPLRSPIQGLVHRNRPLDVCERLGCPPQGLRARGPRFKFLLLTRRLPNNFGRPAVKMGGGAVARDLAERSRQSLRETGMQYIQ